jgi:hypothetical protein
MSRSIENCPEKCGVVRLLFFLLGQLVFYRIELFGQRKDLFIVFFGLIECLLGFDKQKLNLISFLILLRLAFNIFDQSFLLLDLFLLLYFPFPLQVVYFLDVVKLLERGASYFSKVESFYKFKMKIFSTVLVLKQSDVVSSFGWLW